MIRQAAVAWFLLGAIILLGHGRPALAGNRISRITECPE